MRALIERIKQNIPEYRAYDEAATRNSIILPILSKLGWDIFSRDSVYPEYPVGSKRVDYSLRILGQDRFFIETKRCNADLACHQEQLLGYALLFGVELACLTNGITWQFFLPLKSGEWEQRLFYTVDFENQSTDEIEKFFADILCREVVEDRTAVGTAEEIFVRKNKNSIIKKAFFAVWKDIITNPPQEILDVICNKIEKACGYRPDDATAAKFLLKTLRGQTAFTSYVALQVCNEHVEQRENPVPQEDISSPVETILFRGIEIPIERTGSNSRGYFSEVLPKLLSVLTEQELQNLKDISFCKNHITMHDFPLISHEPMMDGRGYHRSWGKKISGYYVYSQWYQDSTLKSWKQYLLGLAQKG